MTLLPYSIPSRAFFPWAQPPEPNTRPTLLLVQLEMATGRIWVGSSRIRTRIRFLRQDPDPTRIRQILIFKIHIQIRMDPRDPGPKRILSFLSNSSKTNDERSYTNTKTALQILTKEKLT